MNICDSWGWQSQVPVLLGLLPIFLMETNVKFQSKVGEHRNFFFPSRFSNSWYLSSGPFGFAELPVPSNAGFPKFYLVDVKEKKGKAESRTDLQMGWAGRTSKDVCTSVNVLWSWAWFSFSNVQKLCLYPFFQGHPGFGRLIQRNQHHKGLVDF